MCPSANNSSLPKQPTTHSTVFATLQHPQNSDGRTLKKRTKYNSPYQNSFGFRTLIIFIDQVSSTKLASIWQQLFLMQSGVDNPAAWKGLSYLGWRLSLGQCIKLCGLRIWLQCSDLIVGRGGGLHWTSAAIYNVNTWCYCFILKIWAYSIPNHKIKRKNIFCLVICPGGRRRSEPDEAELLRVSRRLVEDAVSRALLQYKQETLQNGGGPNAAAAAAAAAQPPGNGEQAETKTDTTANSPTDGKKWRRPSDAQIETEDNPLAPQNTSAGRGHSRPRRPTQAQPPKPANPVRPVCRAGPSQWSLTRGLVQNRSCSSSHSAGGPSAGQISHYLSTVSYVWQRSKLSCTSVVAYPVLRSLAQKKKNTIGTPPYIT